MGNEHQYADKDSLILKGIKEQFIDPNNRYNLPIVNRDTNIFRWLKSKHSVIWGLIKILFWYNIGANLICMLINNSQNFKDLVILNGITPVHAIVFLALVDGILTASLLITIIIDIIKYICPRISEWVKGVYHLHLWK